MRVIAVKRWSFLFLSSSLLVSCAPAGAPPKVFAAKGEKRAVLIFNPGEAPAGALDYLGEGLAARGVTVTFASGAAWRSAADRAMTPSACTQVGGFGKSVTEVARYAVANFDKGVDNALLVGGLIDKGRSFVRSPVLVSNVFAAKDPETPKAVIDTAYTWYPGYSSYTTLTEATRRDFLGPVPASAPSSDPRAQLLDIAEYEVLSRCSKRLDRIEQAAQRKAWDEAQKKAKTPQ